ncbi:MAG: thioredoxin [Bacteroidetes bacterium OLB11]|nr:MAG: thioredoxin [Bacteroidetes bacterium OLB11]
MNPILEDLKKRIGETATIVKIDVDKNPQISQLNQIQGVPTLMIFKNGKAIWRQSGVVPANQLEAIIKSHM